MRRGQAKCSAVGAIVRLYQCTNRAVAAAAVAAAGDAAAFLLGAVGMAAACGGFAAVCITATAAVACFTRLACIA